MSSAKRPTHYETLGLSPTATSDEIERAHARELRRPRTFGGLAQVGIAYAVLKDAEKRGAYDRSIGLGPKPPAFLAAPYGWTTAAAHARPMPRPEEPRTPPQRELPPEPRRETFIASSLRELARPEPLVMTAPEPAPAKTEREPAHPAIWDGAVEESAIPWRWPALVGGGLTLAAIVFGAWAGMSVRDPAAPEAAAAAVTTSLPAAKPRLAPAAKAEPASPRAEARYAAFRPTPPQARARNDRATGAQPPPRPVALTSDEEQQLAGGSFVDSATGQAAAAAGALPDAPAPAGVATAAARLPLSQRTIARTIGRIGYACGSVASIAPADGAGVYKVTCASGDAYQARPVRGRYHFRRWGRN